MKKRKRQRRTSPLTKAVCWVILLALAGGIAYGLKWTWDSCVTYQANSAKTLVGEEMAELSDYLKMDLECTMIPKTGDNDEYIYTLTHDRKAVAAVNLKKTGSGLLGLALFEKNGCSGLRSFDLIIPSDAEVYVSGDKYEFSGEETPVSLQSSSGASYYGFRPRSYKKVKVENIYDFGQISIWDGESKTILCPYKNAYIAVRCFDSSTAEIIAKSAVSCTENYVHYMSNDLSYSVLAQNIIYGAPITNELSQMKVLWFGDHTKTEMPEFHISEPFDIGGGFALVNAQLTYRVYETGGNIQEDDISLTLFMCRDSGGNWKTADIISYVEYPGISDWNTK